MPASLREAYDARLAAGELKPDSGQAAGVAALANLAERLARARPAGLFRAADHVRGIYLFGPVGRGKSMLMDLFFAAGTVQPKRRAHFHAFMARVHGLARVWRSGDEAARREAFGEHRGDDPIPPIARRIAEDARLLCFDELEVSDIADAMILGRLFEALIERGVTLVATSNRPPEDLYPDGINRQLFLPFIDVLKANLEVVAVDGARDWRGQRLRDARAWFSPIDPDNEGAFDALWRDILGRAAPGAEDEAGVTLSVLGRTQHWPRAQGRLLRASFASLCGQALGPADYLAIAERFSSVFLEALPRLTSDRREAARRLTLLVDSLYEARARLIVLAEAEPERLYPAGDLAFEFQRTASRLAEMRARDWGGWRSPIG